MSALERLVGKCAPVHEACHYTAPPLSTKEFKEQCLSMVGEEAYCSPKVNQGITEERLDMAQLLNVDESTVEELEDVCKVESLKCDYDDRFDYSASKIYKQYPDDVPLSTARLVKGGLRKAEESKYVPVFVTGYSSQNTLDLMESKETAAKIEADQLVSKQEVILAVSVYYPDQTYRVQVFHVLASQELAELRDAIKCQADGVIPGEFSSNPKSVEHAKVAKDLYKSGFFFIENTFFNDMRDPLNRDYSRVIIEWAKSSERYSVPGLGHFHKQDMEGVKFEDLSIRLGYPYLYCHQGNCEHILIFTDMRIITEYDAPYVSSYPLEVVHSKCYRKKCSICNMHLVKWITVGSHLAFEDPSFFCNSCFDYLHYTADGKKIADFKAYAYNEKELV